MRAISIFSALAAGLTAASASAAPIKSDTPTTSGGTFIDFEGQAEGDASLLYAGLGLTIAADAGDPVIDNDPFSFGYGSNSGVGVLSINTAPAGITLMFATPAASVEFYLSDTAPLDDYVISAFDSSSTLLESFTVTLAELTADADYFLGFSRAGSDISSVYINPNSDSDAFAIDDLRFAAADVPAPGALGLIGLGAAVLGLRRRRAHR